jgi:hypothetical protein
MGKKPKSVHSLKPGDPVVWDTQDRKGTGVVVKVLLRPWQQDARFQVLDAFTVRIDGTDELRTFARNEVQSIG